MTTKHLVLVETSGNQAYVFATNKLRDVLGASQKIWQAGDEYIRGGSELIRIAGTDFVVDTVEKLTEKGQILVATSGKALLLFDKEEQAKAFVTAWSKKLLTDAPGLDGTGVVSRVQVDMGANCDAENGIAAAVKQAHQEFESARSWRRSPEARFARLPIVAACQVSGRAASAIVQVNKKDVLVSQPVKVKRDAAPEAKKRLEELHDGLGAEPFSDVDEMEKKTEDLEWVAVVHADGNGLGEVFLNFDKHVGPEENGEVYKKYYAAFSKSLDDISREAYGEAVKTVFDLGDGKDEKKKKIAIIPIVVAGDDLTIIMDGRKALAFTEVFMKEFCERTQKTVNDPYRNCLPELLKTAKTKLGAPRLGMAAGVCICKPHFPFSTAYTLAEELMKNAKKVKTELNYASAAMDFHILYDTTATSIEEIREKLSHPDKDENGEKCKRRLTGKPFVVDPKGKHEDGTDVEEKPWFKAHNWADFKSAVAAIQAKSEDKDKKRLLPSSQSHAVREMLFSQTPETQNAEWNLLMTKYKKFKEQWGGDGLYRKENGEPYTLFLDALEAADFYVAPEKKKEAGNAKKNPPN